MRTRPPIGPGRVAAVTGAASGIGRALALALGRAGVTLALGDVDEAGLDSLVHELATTGTTARPHVVDVTDGAAVRAWADDVVSRSGAVHMIWNVAGVIAAGDVLHAPLTDLERLLAVDLWGVVHGTTAFLPHVVAAGGGHVVNVSSAFGLISAPDFGAYNAAKFAVRGWTDALRQEMRRDRTGVVVTCVYPGAVRTPILRRATSAAGPDDAARRADRFDRLARTTPDAAAARILAGVRAGRPRVLVGADARLADLLARVTGTGYERLLTRSSRDIRRS